MSKFAGISTVSTRVIKLQLLLTKELVYLSQFTHNGNDIIEYCRWREMGGGVCQEVRNKAVKAVKEALTELKQAYDPCWIDKPLWDRFYELKLEKNSEAL